MGIEPAMVGVTAPRGQFQLIDGLVERASRVSNAQKDTRAHTRAVYLAVSNDGGETLGAARRCPRGRVCEVGVRSGRGESPRPGR